LGLGGGGIEGEARSEIRFIWDRNLSIQRMMLYFDRLDYLPPVVLGCNDVFHRNKTHSNPPAAVPVLCHNWHMYEKPVSDLKEYPTLRHVHILDRSGLFDTLFHFP
jgi:hypothetical protein